ncbi:hypothetical protein HMPREF9534_02281 [Escherichia coli MS 69-1]|nr:hypothetical protein HMPREF9534_02281 [Escherichia coli MS 69-1]
MGLSIIKCILYFRRKIVRCYQKSLILWMGNISHQARYLIQLPSCRIMCSQISGRYI